MSCDSASPGAVRVRCSLPPVSSRSTAPSMAASSSHATLWFGCTASASRIPPIGAVMPSGGAKSVVARSASSVESTNRSEVVPVVSTNAASVAPPMPTRSRPARRTQRDIERPPPTVATRAAAAGSAMPSPGSSDGCGAVGTAGAAARSAPLVARTVTLLLEPVVDARRRGVRAPPPRGRPTPRRDRTCRARPAGRRRPRSSNGANRCDLGLLDGHVPAVADGVPRDLRLPVDRVERVVEDVAVPTRDVDGGVADADLVCPVTPSSNTWCEIELIPSGAPSGELTASGDAVVRPGIVRSRPCRSNVLPKL